MKDYVGCVLGISSVGFEEDRACQADFKASLAAWQHEKDGNRRKHETTAKRVQRLLVPQGQPLRRSMFVSLLLLLLMLFGCLFACWLLFLCCCSCYD